MDRAFFFFVGQARQQAVPSAAVGRPDNPRFSESSWHNSPYYEVVPMIKLKYNKNKTKLLRSSL
jgi:hypothetical protein